MLWILLLVSFVLVIVANIATRVGYNTLQIYDNLPEKFKMTNKNLLKLYIVYPKSLVTKSSFILYISQILLFIAILVLFLIQLIAHITINEKLIYIVCMAYFFGCYILSFGFDRIVYFIYKNKEKNKI